MKQLQAEHAEWLAREFPEQPKEIPLCGLVEEAGELLHAVLKLEQERLWGKDPRYAAEKLRHELFDAVGDVGIYACSLCNTMGWDFEEILRGRTFTLVASTMDAARQLVVDAARLSDFLSEVRLHSLLLDLRSIASKLGFHSLEHVVRETWQVVKLRRRDAKQGRPTVVCLCGSTRFYKEFQQANFDETMAGRIVLSVGFLPGEHHGESVGLTNAGYPLDAKAKLDELHKRKIDLADEVLILNVGGYIGESTNSEYEYAQRTGKRIRFWTTEQARPA